MDLARQILGPHNGLLDYGAVLLVYALLVVIMPAETFRVPLNFRRSFAALYLGWVGSVFPGNYVCYRLGIMSFLPWLDNVLHCFVWIGLCLGFLYSKVHHLSMSRQFLMFVVFSFIVKYAERTILGTWEHPHFFFVFRGNLAYIVGWSLMDGLYPVLSTAGLRMLSSRIPGLVTPATSGA